ncbi:HEAT repeat domain-containing protein [Pseudomonas chlororaphis]|uniref:hypothetical protein n=1 Tax=Pseudomonas chlororaphis TaxID=587753 RepID=UPI0039E2D57F
MTPSLAFPKDDFPRAILRSLLQKAIRRGYIGLTERVAYLLAEHGDSAWLRARAGVIVFEECWPFAARLRQNTATIKIFQEIAKLKKNKDASGLGSLAYAYSTGDRSAASYSQDDLAVRIVAAGLRRPDAFFNWVESKNLSMEQTEVINSARSTFKRATWPWDKAFTIAASYLALSPIAQPSASLCISEENFPIWVAIDKHTKEGRLSLKRVASQLNISSRDLSWISFYLEGAKVNDLVDSIWWSDEKKWRFSQLKITEDQAIATWKKASNIIQEDLLMYTHKIEHLVSAIK